MNASQGAVSGSANSSRKGTLENLIELAGRVLLAVLFLLSGLGKLGAYTATAAFMSSAGVPGVLLPLVIAFHHNFADQMQMIEFLKDVSIAGGLLLLVAKGAGPLSIDR
jgi:putative oxidoreductase